MGSFLPKWFSILKSTKTPPKIGLALSAGVARGMSHVGVLQALKSLHYPIDAIAGCSMGALVGAAYACDGLDGIEQQALGYTRSSLWRLFDVSWPQKGGLAKGEKVMRHLAPFIQPIPIKHLPIRYGAVACTLAGKEVWITDGLVTDAVRASISLPVLFAPAWDGTRWLMDGAIVNPVPVSLCRTLGVDVVIAVRNSEVNKNLAGGKKAGRRPSSLHAFGSAVDALVGQVGRYRLKVEPADYVLDVPIAEMGLLDFHLAKKALNAGREVVHQAQAELTRLLKV